MSLPEPPAGRSQDASGTGERDPVTPATPAAVAAGHRHAAPTRVLTVALPRPRWPGRTTRSVSQVRRSGDEPGDAGTGRGDRAPAGQAAEVAEAAGRAFARLTVAPAIAAIAWLVPGLPLLLAGEFSPVPVLLIAAPLAAGLAVNALHRVPSRWPVDLPGRGRDRAWMPWSAMLGTAAVAVGFAVWQLATSSPQVIAARTPGALFQAGYWIAQHGSLPIPGSLAAFGGARAGLHLSSIGFFQQGGSVVPGVLPGLPMLLAAGFWTSGIGGGAVVGPVLGAAAVLSFGGLAGRLAGRQWAPAGALALALTLPEIVTSREAFSETAVQVLLFGGLNLVLDALSTAGAAGGATGVPRGAVRRRAAPWRAAPWRAVRRAGLTGLRPRLVAALTTERMLAGLGGLALGLASLVSFGSLPYLVPVIAVAGILVAARRAAGLAFCLGLLAGVGYGIAAGYVLARPLADSLAPVLGVIGRDAAGILVLTAVTAVVLARVPRARGIVRRALAGRPLRWLPGFGAAAVAVALAGLGARPYLETVRGVLGRAEAGYVATLQRAAGLQVDPTRLYSEDTLYWVIWYAGIPALLLGGFGAAVLLRRCLRALLTWRDPTGAGLNWALPLAVVLGGAAAVLWQPFTVPDQPWASRRLVPAVLPGLILLATWASAWLVRRARDRGASAATGGVVAVFCVGAMVLPISTTSFGVGFSHSGVGGGLRPSTGGMAQRRVGAGEDAAVQALCAAIGRSSSVVIVDRRVAQVFTQVIRGVCGVPVAWVAQGTPPPAVDRVLGAIARTGRHPVVLGARPEQVAGYGAPPMLALKLVTTQNPHELTGPPGAPPPARYVIWLTVASAPGAGL